MELGNNLFKTRKKAGLSQEDVAEKLGVSRQTISKWETDETVPDIYQAKRLANIFNVSLDDLIYLDEDLQEIEEKIINLNEKKEERFDWTSAWSKKYPALATYQEKVNIPKYAMEIRKMLNSLTEDYGLNNLDSMLVLKDILYHEWKDKK